MVVFVFFSIDKHFIFGMYGLDSKFKFLYEYFVKERFDLNPRSIINLKYLNEKMAKVKTFNPLKYYKIFIRNIHPFIDYDFIIEEYGTKRFRVYQNIEKIIEKKLFFPMKKFKDTDFSLTYETGPLSIMDFLHLAGNVYVQEGRELFITSEFT